MNIDESVIQQFHEMKKPPPIEQRRVSYTNYFCFLSLYSIITSNTKLLHMMLFNMVCFKRMKQTNTMILKKILFLAWLNYVIKNC